MAPFLKLPLHLLVDVSCFVNSHWSLEAKAHISGEIQLCERKHINPWKYMSSSRLGLNLHKENQAQAALPQEILTSLEIQSTQPWTGELFINRPSYLEDWCLPIPQEITGKETLQICHPVYVKTCSVFTNRSYRKYRCYFYWVSINENLTMGPNFKAVAVNFSHIVLGNILFPEVTLQQMAKRKQINILSMPSSFSRQGLIEAQLQIRTGRMIRKQWIL